MNSNATNEGKTPEKALLTTRPLGAPEVQLYHALHTEVKTMFPGGCWGGEPSPTVPMGSAQSL